MRRLLLFFLLAVAAGCNRPATVLDGASVGRLEVVGNDLEAISYDYTARHDLFLDATGRRCYERTTNSYGHLGSNPNVRRFEGGKLQPLDADITDFLKPAPDSLTVWGSPGARSERAQLVEVPCS